MVNGLLQELILGEQRPHPRLQLVVVQFQDGLAGEEVVDGYVDGARAGGNGGGLGCSGQADRNLSVWRLASRASDCLQSRESRECEAGQSVSRVAVGARQRHCVLLCPVSNPIKRTEINESVMAFLKFSLLFNHLSLWTVIN